MKQVVTSFPTRIKQATLYNAFKTLEGKYMTFYCTLLSCTIIIWLNNKTKIGNTTNKRILLPEKKVVGQACWAQWAITIKYKKLLLMGVPHYQAL